MRTYLTLFLCLFLSMGYACQFNEQLDEQLEKMVSAKNSLVILPTIQSFKERVIEAAVKIAVCQIDISLAKLEYQPNYRYPTSYDFKSQNINPLPPNLKRNHYEERIRKNIYSHPNDSESTFLDNVREGISYVVHEVIHEIYNYFKFAEEISPSLDKQLHFGQNSTPLEEDFIKQHERIDHFFGTNGRNFFLSGQYNKQQSKFTQGALPSPRTIGGHSVKNLLDAAKTHDRGGLTKAGRALAKHGGRPNSVFPKPNGSPKAINKQGHRELKNILKDPNNKVYCLKNGDLKVYSPNGRGASFKKDGIFKGFIERQYE